MGKYVVKLVEWILLVLKIPINEILLIFFQNRRVTFCLFYEELLSKSEQISNFMCIVLGELRMLVLMYARLRNLCFR